MEKKIQGIKIRLKHMFIVNYSKEFQVYFFKLSPFEVDKNYFFMIIYIILHTLMNKYDPISY